MTVVQELDNSFLFIDRAYVVNDEIETASEWAAKHITTNKAIKWIVGKYAEADQANSNGQFFELAGLRVAQPSIQFSPMNIDHHQNEIVGTWTASEMLYPKSGNTIANPYIEVLGAFWRAKFPETMQRVESAFNTGMLALSMEAIGESVTCVGNDSCGKTFDFKGPFDPSYCDHINERASDRQLNKPWFMGGALILPPNKPGWGQATVDEIAKHFSDERAQSILDEIEVSNPELTPKEMEKLMFGYQLAAFERKS